jgi:hypothetical protein
MAKSDSGDKIGESGDDGDKVSAHSQLIAWIMERAAAKVRQQRGDKKDRPKKVTQTAVADAIDVSDSMVSRWINEGRLPQEGTLNDSVFPNLKVPLDEQTEILKLRQKALEEARQGITDGYPGERRPRTAGKLAVPAQARPRSQALTAAVTDGSASSGPPADALPDPTRPAQLAQSAGEDDGTDGACDDAGDAGDVGASSQERGPGVISGTTTAQLQHEGHNGQDHSTAGPPPAAEDIPKQLAKVLQHLADAVYDECDQIASDPRHDLQLPLPIPLRWRLADGQCAQAVDNAVTGQRRLERFAPLPGITAAAADTVQAGGPDELFALYAGLVSGRIVVTGRYGSGKSAAALLTMLDALDHRRALPRELRWQVPVPVLLTADSWNPRRQSLRTWLADQLAIRHEFLTSDAYGVDVAGELVRRGKVALFLEGLDQMEQGLRRDALKSLAAEHAIRLVVMSRPDEYADAAASVPFPGALVVQLEPVPVEDAAEHLRRRQDGPGSHSICAVIEHLRQQPDSPLTQALDSPLNLTLLRADIAANEPLLEPGRFRTRRQVGDFLLARFVPRAYSIGRPEGLTEQEERAWNDHIAAQLHKVGFIATQMEGTDLAWWRMHHWAPARWRLLANIVVGVVVMGALGMLVFGPIGRYTVLGHTGLGFGIRYGAFMGFCFGVLAGAVSEARELRPARRAAVEEFLNRCCPAVVKRRWPQLGGSGVLALFNPAIALLILTIMIMAVGNQSGHPVVGHLLFGLPAGLIAAAVTGYAATRARLLPINRSRWAALRPTRADLLAALSTGAPIGLTYGLTKTPQFGVLAGLFTGFTFGLMTAVTRPISNPDISTTPFTRWRQDRNRALRIGLVAGTPIGLALGIQNGLAHGPLAGITATIGLGTIIALGCMIGISDCWRTTLLFAQLHLHQRWRHFRHHEHEGVFPLRGMQFLQDAWARDVMRISGPYLQFWHTRLQELLTADYTRDAAGSATESTDKNI